ncbi:hypothetical protein Dimus_016091, partial [Dionaea muscipula]
MVAAIRHVWLLIARLARLLARREGDALAGEDDLRCRGRRSLLARRKGLLLALLVPTMPPLLA